MMRTRTVKAIAVLIVLTVSTLAALGWDIVQELKTTDTFYENNQSGNKKSPVEVLGPRRGHEVEPAAVH